MNEEKYIWQAFCESKCREMRKIEGERFYRCAKRERKCLPIIFFFSFILDMKDFHNDSKQAHASWELAIFFNRVRGFNKFCFVFFFFFFWYMAGTWESSHMWKEKRTHVGREVIPNDWFLGNGWYAGLPTNWATFSPKRFNKLTCNCAKSPHFGLGPSQINERVGIYEKMF